MTNNINWQYNICDIVEDIARSITSWSNTCTINITIFKHILLILVDIDKKYAYMIIYVQESCAAKDKIHFLKAYINCKIVTYTKNQNKLTSIINQEILHLKKIQSIIS